MSPSPAPHSVFRAPSFPPPLLTSSTPPLVFTNGCFDLFHSGHVDFLRRCRLLGQRLIVGLNSDESVRRVKGPTRPICNQFERWNVLEACRYVDEVILFDEDTPCNLIAHLRPVTIVKGPGYTEETMPESPLVKSYGGRVILLDGPNISTTNIIDRVMRATTNNTNLHE